MVWINKRGLAKDDKALYKIILRGKENIDIVTNSPANEATQMALYMESSLLMLLKKRLTISLDTKTMKHLSNITRAY